MTATHALATGDRFLDTRGHTWAVLECGQLQNTLAPGVLIRSWGSLDTCLGPLTKETTMPRQYRDRDGDTWTVQEDGSVQYKNVRSTRMTMESANRNWGPLAPADDDADVPTLNAQSEPEPPNYYVFPGGVQVKVISRHLTSNAGQAVQYLARSSRIDGVRKEDPLRDLRKARDMIDDEISRLEDAA